jgi:hypothetical protein
MMVKEGGMEKTCSTNAGAEECLHGFGAKTKVKETTK